MFCNRTLTAALLVFLLSAGAALHLATKEGERSMKNAIDPGGEAAAKPAIDGGVPKMIETATFALG